ncbi:MAG: Nif3-like dinuclear metal center hexameric protein [Gemmatimonadales bacterium]
MKSNSETAAGVPLARIVTWLDDILQTESTPDYPGALNGLQLANRGTVTKVAAAVDFSTRSARAAIEANVDLLIVHHGMFWAGAQAIVGQRFSRLAELIEAGVAVYSSHLPLDCHPQLGNNVLLAKTLGLDPSGEFARFKNIFVGVQGTSETSTQTLVDRARAFSRSHGGDTIATASDPGRVTHRWAICTGSGASAETLDEATRDDIDTLIVGEGPHWTAVDASDRGIAIIYVGHYASETLGVYALAAEVSKQFDVPSICISAPTGL